MGRRTGRHYGTRRGVRPCGRTCGSSLEALELPGHQRPIGRKDSQVLGIDFAPTIDSPKAQRGLGSCQADPKSEASISIRLQRCSIDDEVLGEIIDFPFDFHAPDEPSFGIAIELGFNLP